jgi:hypothetical protein
MGLVRLCAADPHFVGRSLLVFVRARERAPVKTETVTIQQWTATPNGRKESEVFTEMHVSSEGAAITFPAGVIPGRLVLADSGAAAVLEELARSARLRLLELEQKSLQMEKTDGPRTAAAAVGAAAARTA